MTTLNLNDVFKLPPGERLRIAAAIWDSVADHSEQISITPTQSLELDARYADYLEHPQDGTPWTVVKSQILQSQ